VILLEHRRTSRKEGVGILCLAWGTAAILIGSLSVVCWTGRMHGVIDSVFYVMFCGMALLMSALATWMAVSHVRQGGEFVLRIDERNIECRVPLAGAGDSFKLPIQDIVKVEHDMRDDQSEWYLHDKAGHRYLLTINYGNPILDIVELLQRLNPAIEEVHTH
jgi:hypothetical protein